MKLLKCVLDNYLSSKNIQKGKANFSGSADQVSLQEKLPEFFNNILKEIGRLGGFKVEGSFGAGNMANIPWVAIFNKKVTTTAQDGYYIVLLFSEDMSGCYLSLNQGFTRFGKQYSSSVAHYKIKQIAKNAKRFFQASPNSIAGEISLSASGDLGKGYQVGAIESFFYKHDALPTEQEFTSNFKELLGYYDKILDGCGVSLDSLCPATESQFQNSVIEKAISKKKRNKIGIADNLIKKVDVPERRLLKGQYRHVRDPAMAAQAVLSANFKCELGDEHKTFTASSKKLPYIEAHHLVPMEQQDSFTYSLDVPANIVALCPFCHKLLHHAVLSEKREFLIDLLRRRRDSLQESGISVSEESLLSYYDKDYLDED